MASVCRSHLRTQWFPASLRRLAGRRPPPGVAALPGSGMCGPLPPGRQAPYLSGGCGPGLADAIVVRQLTGKPAKPREVIMKGKWWLWGIAASASGVGVVVGIKRDDIRRYFRLREV